MSVIVSDAASGGVGNLDVVEKRGGIGWAFGLTPIPGT